MSISLAEKFVLLFRWDGSCPGVALLSRALWEMIFSDESFHFYIHWFSIILMVRSPGATRRLGTYFSRQQIYWVAENILAFRNIIDCAFSLWRPCEPLTRNERVLTDEDDIYIWLFAFDEISPRSCHNEAYDAFDIRGDISFLFDIWHFEARQGLLFACLHSQYFTFIWCLPDNFGPFAVTPSPRTDFSPEHFDKCLLRCFFARWYVVSLSILLPACYGLIFSDF